MFLPSGGSLVIDRTEAMTVVDVNTGKFTGSGGNLEETVTKNNLEAAEEIVRQLRLRDIGGIIVIDFIDMVLEYNRDLVLRRLVECLGRDRTRHQVAEVTSLGLVQMTRKRIGHRPAGGLQPDLRGLQRPRHHHARRARRAPPLLHLRASRTLPAHRPHGPTASRKERRKRGRGQEQEQEPVVAQLPDAPETAKASAARAAFATIAAAAHAAHEHELEVERGRASRGRRCRLGGDRSRGRPPAATPWMRMPRTRAPWAVPSRCSPSPAKRCRCRVRADAAARPRRCRRRT